MVRGADALICCSEAEASLIREHFGDRMPISVVPHGVDAAADELRRWYRTADAFVTMSREEAFGLTVLEAVAAGAAIIAPDIPAYTEQARTLPDTWLRLVGVDAAAAELAAAIRGVGRREASGMSRPVRGWEPVCATTSVYRTVLDGHGRTLAGGADGAAA